MARNLSEKENGGLEMFPFRLDFAFEKLEQTGPKLEHNLLRIYTGYDLPESEAKRLFDKISDHKWFVSERLRRDVGFHVAAIDYVEHFYEPYARAETEGKIIKLLKNVSSRTAMAARRYFETKGQTLSH